MKINGYLVPNNLIRYVGNMTDRINSSYKDDILFIQVVNFSNESLRDKAIINRDQNKCKQNERNDLIDFNQNENLVQNYNVNKTTNVILPENDFIGDNNSNYNNSFEFEDNDKDADRELDTFEENDQIFEIAHVYAENEEERFINDVKDIVNNISTISQLQKNKLFATLCKFRKLFSEKEESGESMNTKLG